MNQIVYRLALALCAFLIVNQASAEIVSVTVSGTITQAPSGLAGISAGTPYLWQATYDSSAPSEALMFVQGGAFASVLTTNLTIGSFSWTGDKLGGSPYMAIQCCQGILNNPDAIAFWANPVTGPAFNVSGLTYGPQAIRYYFSQAAVPLPSTDTPSAKELASLTGLGLDLWMHSTTTEYDEFEILGGPAKVVTITSVPEPAAAMLLSMGFAVVFCWCQWRSGRFRASRS